MITQLKNHNTQLTKKTVGITQFTKISYLELCLHLPYILYLQVRNKFEIDTNLGSVRNENLVSEKNVHSEMKTMSTEAYLFIFTKGNEYDGEYANQLKYCSNKETIIENIVQDGRFVQCDRHL